MALRPGSCTWMPDKREETGWQIRKIGPNLDFIQNLDFHSSLIATFSSWKQNSMSQGYSQKGRENACSNNNNVNKGLENIISGLERKAQICSLFASHHEWQRKSCILFHFPGICHCPELPGKVLPHDNQSGKSSLCSRLENWTQLQYTLYMCSSQQQ